jgi:hypothetical protein
MTGYAQGAVNRTRSLLFDILSITLRNSEIQHYSKSGNHDTLVILTRCMRSDYE